MSPQRPTKTIRCLMTFPWPSSSFRTLVTTPLYQSKNHKDNQRQYGYWTVCNLWLLYQRNAFVNLKLCSGSRCHLIGTASILQKEGFKFRRFRISWPSHHPKTNNEQTRPCRFPCRQRNKEMLVIKEILRATCTYQ